MKEQIQKYNLLGNRLMVMHVHVSPMHHHIISVYRVGGRDVGDIVMVVTKF